MLHASFYWRFSFFIELVIQISIVDDKMTEIKRGDKLSPGISFQHFEKVFR